MWNDVWRRPGRTPAAIAIPEQVHKRLNAGLMNDLETMLRNNNSYVQTYISSMELERRAEQRGDPFPDVFMSISETGVPRRGMFGNEEVAAFIPGSEQTAGHRSVCIMTRDDTIRKISNLNASYHPLHYPLLFPHGEVGWCPKDRLENKVSNLAHTRFRMHERPERESTHLLQAGALTQEYVVDSWAQIEDQELDWYRHNQDKLRTATFSGITDVVAGA
jgi:hypothetical protein